jgi:predicted acetyltransferase
MEIRPIERSEVRRFRQTVLGVFGADLDDDEERLARGDASFAALVDLERTIAAFDGDDLVGGSSTFDLELAICGGTLAVGGLTMVAVKPSHHRRGILRRFIDAHIAGCRERGQVVSALWASEAAIYGRFGFGPAADHQWLNIDAGQLRVPGDLGRDDSRLYHDATAAGSAEARDAIVDIYERVWRSRPGLYQRGPSWWQHRIFNRERPGVPENRVRALITRRGGDNTGFVAFRQKPDMSAERPRGRVEIIELHGVDAEAEASLWRFVTAIDLFPRVSYRIAPTDCVLPWLTPDIRSVNRQRADSLWLRLIDLPAALAARRYSATGALSIACGGVTVRLEVDDAGVTSCESVHGDADLDADPDALGAIYLGGVDPTILWRAGRIRGDHAAVEQARRMFAWHVEPWCCEVF